MSHHIHVKLENRALESKHWQELLSTKSHKSDDIRFQSKLDMCIE